MKFDIQLNQGAAPWAHIVDSAHAAQQSGFDTVWMLDHFSGSMFGADSMLECFTCLGALAQATTDIRVGSLVANVANRSAGLLALASASVSQISGGRFSLGVGAGTSPESAFAAEQNALGIAIPTSLEERHDKLVNVVEEVRGLWSSDRPDDFDGFPTLDIAPPIIIGVNSVALAHIAGTIADGINVRASHPRWRDFVDAARRSHDSQDTTGEFDVSVWAAWDEFVFDEASSQRREWQEAGVNRIVLVPRGAPDVAAIGRASIA